MIFNPNITVIGYGNVAHHLVSGLQAAEFTIDQIYNRSGFKETEKAQLTSVKCIDQFSDLLPSSDLYILAVRDDALEFIVKQLTLYIPRTSLMAHTSGSVSIEVFSPYFSAFGTIYPLQTFTTEDVIDWSTIPIIVSSSSSRIGNRLSDVASALSPIVLRYTDQQRSSIHLSAVIVNNFTNVLIKQAFSYLEQEHIDPQILLPLLLKTVDKLNHISPQEAQTGPASRGDINTIHRHMRELENYTELKSIYNFLSKLINPNLPL